ncbi:lytic murein transglycosylase [Sphingobium aquiterrae]|uniref:lytic murein transglycosylase n=1 Tax=Sphingobium aquiterrae TaxID=2038656 RepID=UPI00301754FF
MRRSINTILAGAAALCAIAAAGDDVPDGQLVTVAHAQEPAGAATPDDDGLQAYLQSLRPKARAMGIGDATINAVFPTLTLNPRVVQLDQSQPGGSFDSPIPNFEPYRQQHVDSARIGRGRTAYAANRDRLSRIERETGVPESIMVAIYGHETNYGSYVGDFDLLRSLATLAHEGRRRALFEPEFLAALKIVDQGVPRSKLVGSWAGAMGYPQFLPSVYLRVARDGDGDGRADIWASEADALASIANYFVNAGWRKGQPWGVAVRVPAGFDRAAVAGKTMPARCPRVFNRHSRWLTMAEWRARGIVPQGGMLPADNVLATLLEPDGQGKIAYLLTGNYRVILDYNCSNFYALSVGLLADAVAQ